MFACAPTRRRIALATVSALAVGTAAPAWAAPPPIAPVSVVPPGRVGRLAQLAGTVSFHTADADQWSPATLNYPISSGNAFWTEPGARADLQVASNGIAMAPSTEFDVITLDDHALAASEPQGEAYMHLRSVPAGDSYAVQTPRGLVQIAAVGRYEIVAGDADHPTLVTVRGRRRPGTGQRRLAAGRSAADRYDQRLDTLQGSVGPIAQDAFLTGDLAREQPAPRATAPVPAVVQQMTGCEDIDQQGSWQQTPQYGAVWYPPVDAGWVPYRHGRWSYVAPWGWTWVDEAAWGFAPFHYGRWAQVKTAGAGSRSRRAAMASRRANTRYRPMRQRWSASSISERRRPSAARSASPPAGRSAGCRSARGRPTTRRTAGTWVTCGG